MNLRSRLVRYDELVPCLNAFIDARSPGSDRKENFTVIGPGVAENPEQHVHITLPHGFNIGGARQPPGCLNSQHSHLTNEVFLVHSGTWAFRSGVDAGDGEIVLREGDVISLPTGVFRGFENVGDDVGYLYAILGRDDPGRVLWAPQVFDLAEKHGLVLLEDGSLVDTTLGQAVPADKRPMPRTTAEQVAAHRAVNSEQMKGIVVRAGDYAWRRDTALSKFAGVEEAALLGPANAAERLPAASMPWPHEFVFRALRLQPGALVPAHQRAEEEVIFVLRGKLSVEVEGERLELARGDTFSTPIGSVRSFQSTGTEPCIAYFTRSGDSPAQPEFSV
jgi:quercetin dioxygenase-like cupin family protein